MRSIKAELNSKDVENKMKHIVGIIEDSIKTGLKGTTYEDRLLPQQSHLIAKAEKKNKILENSIVNNIIFKCFSHYGV